jgi:hypothetical protein
VEQGAHRPKRALGNPQKVLRPTCMYPDPAREQFSHSPARHVVYVAALSRRSYPATSSAGGTQVCSIISCAGR